MYAGGQWGYRENGGSQDSEGFGVRSLNVPEAPRTCDSGLTGLLWESGHMSEQLLQCHLPPGREVSPAHQYALAGAVSFPFFWLAGAGSAVFWVLGKYRVWWWR